MKKFWPLLPIFFAAHFALPLSAQDASVRKAHFNIDNEVALSGYDPVAYLKNNAAIKGQRSQAVFYEGIVYYFSSTENKEAFKKNPASYEPEYGGWCAYAMGAKGKKVEINPETFKIVNGKLFLFYNKGRNNTLLAWNKEEQKFIASAAISWKQILH